MAFSADGKLIFVVTNFKPDVVAYDSRTGKVTEYPSPYGERGTRDMFEDSAGRIWYGAQPYFKAGYFRIRSEAERVAAQAR